jgi:signal transduction histidine kinase
MVMGTAQGKSPGARAAFLPPGRRRPETEIVRLRAQVRALEKAKRTLESEVVQHRQAEDLARGQSHMLIQSLGILAAESNLDTFLGHVLKVTVQQLEGVGGTLWFPDPLTGTTRLHLEYLGERIIPASESQHPAVLRPPPVGGRGVSTFPVEHAETYVLSGEVAGMPEENRAYIYSLGVRTLLTVPMILGNESAGWICVRSSKADLAELESKIHLAEALAGQATLAVQMARLGEQAREAAVLSERNRIARDIHDTLAQGFTGVVVNLEAADRTLRKHNVEVALEHIEHARGLARACLDEARLSVRALRPDALREASFEQALQAQIQRMAASGTQAQLRTVGKKIALSCSSTREHAMPRSPCSMAHKPCAFPSGITGWVSTPPRVTMASACWVCASAPSASERAWKFPANPTAVPWWKPCCPWARHPPGRRTHARAQGSSSLQTSSRSRGRASHSCAHRGRSCAGAARLGSHHQHGGGCHRGGRGG